MTLDPVSVAVGIVATYAVSLLLLLALRIAESRQAKKELDRELDRLLAEVGIACIERPMNVRSN